MTRCIWQTSEVQYATSIPSIQGTKHFQQLEQYQNLLLSADFPADVQPTFWRFNLFSFPFSGISFDRLVKPIIRRKTASYWFSFSYLKCIIYSFHVWICCGPLLKNPSEPFLATSLHNNYNSVRNLDGNINSLVNKILIKQKKWKNRKKKSTKNAAAESLNKSDRSSFELFFLRQYFWGGTVPLIKKFLMKEEIETSRNISFFHSIILV